MLKSCRAIVTVKVPRHESALSDRPWSWLASMKSRHFSLAKNKRHFAGGRRSRHKDCLVNRTLLPTYQYLIRSNRTQSNYACKTLRTEDWLPWRLTSHNKKILLAACAGTQRIASPTNWSFMTRLSRQVCPGPGMGTLQIKRLITINQEYFQSVVALSCSDIVRHSFGKYVGLLVERNTQKCQIMRWRTLTDMCIVLLKTWLLSRCSFEPYSISIVYIRSCSRIVWNTTDGFSKRNAKFSNTKCHNGSTRLSNAALTKTCFFRWKLLTAKTVFPNPFYWFLSAAVMLKKTT